MGGPPLFGPPPYLFISGSLLPEAPSGGPQLVSLAEGGCPLFQRPSREGGGNRSR